MQKAFGTPADEISIPGADDQNLTGFNQPSNCHVAFVTEKAEGCIDATRGQPQGNTWHFTEIKSISKT